MVYQKEYSWKISHRVPAQVAGEVMEKIEQRDGKLTKEAFLEESRPADSPTHELFEWDDGIAAEKFRLEQARHTINDIQVKIIRNDSEMKTPAFVKVTVGAKTKADYINVETTMQTDDYRRAAIQNAIDELKAIEQKYNTYVELEKIFIAVHEAEKLYCGKEKEA